MRVRRAGSSGNVLLEVGPRESDLLAKASSSRPAFRLKRILVAIDFSQSSHKALEYAVSFARQFEAEIVCLHVVEIPYGTGEVGFVAQVEELRKDLFRDTRKQLDKLLAREAADLESKAEIRSGIAYHEIVEAAREQQIDLIILATRGRTGLRRVFLGSTAERVVRHAHCPVLVVREDERDFIESAAAQSKAGKKAESGRVRTRRAQKG